MAANKIHQIPSASAKTVKVVSQSEIRQHSFDIEMAGLEANILFGAIFEKLDTLIDHIGGDGPVSESVMEAFNAVNCFTSCAHSRMATIMDSNAKLLHGTCGVPA
jgi:hypothetical protein